MKKLLISIHKFFDVFLNLVIKLFVVCILFLIGCYLYFSVELVFLKYMCIKDNNSTECQHLMYYHRVVNGV